MKKQLLLSAAAAFALSGFAANPSVGEVVANAKLERVKPVFEAVHAEKATVNTPAKAPRSYVYYKYPRGLFYGTGLVFGDGEYLGGYGQNYGMLKVRPYVDMTFVNQSYNPNGGSIPTPTWSWESYEFDVNDWVSNTYTGEELTIDYFRGEEGYAPEMKVGTATFGKSCFYYNQTSGNKEIPTIMFPLEELGPDFAEPNGLESCIIPSASGWFGWNTRQGGIGGIVYYTGNVDPDDENSDTFNWFGSGSPYDAMATFIPAPGDDPYAIEAAYLYCFGKSEVAIPLTVDLYKVEQPACEENNYVAVLGEKMATGTIEHEFTPDDDGEPADWIIRIPFTDEEGWEWTPEVDYDAMLVVTGYNVPELEEFSFLLSRDSYNSGYGSLTYLGYSVGEETETPELNGLESFFKSGPLYCACSILFNPLTPWILNNYNAMPSEVDVPAEGAVIDSFEVEGIDEPVPFQLFASVPSEEWDISTVDGDFLPDWIEIECGDEYEENAAEEMEFTGLVDVELSVAALPEGVKGRSCEILFHTPGAKYVFTVTQGEVSGVNGITADKAEIVGVEYYNLQGQRLSAAPVNGAYIVKSLLSNGKSVAKKVAK